jgi:TolA-binding protein
MKQLSHAYMHIFSILVVSSIMLGSCSSSGESSKESAPSQPPALSATETIQKELRALKVENDSLKLQLSTLQEHNRSVVVHSAEMEAQVAELRGKLAAVPPPPTKPAIANSRTTYESALMMFRSRKYAEAASILQGILDARSAGSLESNCHYWLGECSYGTRNFKEAVAHFERVFGFARTTKKDDAQIMIANSYLAMGSKTEAKAEYQKLIDKFPASPYTKIAKAKMSHL